MITSDLGGMREAVIDGKTGFCLPRGSVPAWSETLLRLAADTKEFDACISNLPVPNTWAENVSDTLALLSNCELETA